MTKRLQGVVTPDRTRVTVEFSPESGASGKLELTQNDLLSLIQTLGKLHSVMSEGKEIPKLEGQQIDAVFDTRWYVNPEMMGEATAMSFLHPAYGPLAFLIPINQIHQMIGLLNAQVGLSQQSKQTKN
jgi:hypothetical protein